VIKDQIRLPKSKLNATIGHKSEKQAFSEVEAKRIIRDMSFKIQSCDIIKNN
jgi:hypothetical protein